MATKEQKKMYNERVKPYKSTLEELRKKSSSMKMSAKKNAKLAPYFTVGMAIEAVKITNTLLQMSALSKTIQDYKNENLITDARKELSTVLSELVRAVGEYMDDSLTDNQETLVKLKMINPAHRLRILEQLNQALDRVTEAMGSSSKYRWYISDLYLKLAIISKNMFDFKEFDRIRKDPNAEHHRDYQEFLRFVVNAGHNAAQEFRSKYELGSQDVSDLQTIEKIFQMLKRIYSFTGNKEEVEKMKNSLDSLSERINRLMAEKKK